MCVCVCVCVCVCAGVRLCAYVLEILYMMINKPMTIGEVGFTNEVVVKVVPAMVVGEEATVTTLVDVVIEGIAVVSLGLLGISDIDAEGVITRGGTERLEAGGSAMLVSDGDGSAGDVCRGKFDEVGHGARDPPEQTDVTVTPPKEHGSRNAGVMDQHV